MSTDAAITDANRTRDALPARSPLRIAVLISGGGTTLRNLLAKIATGTLDVRVECVIASTAKAGGLKYAVEADIPKVVVDSSQFSSEAAFSQAVFDSCRAARVDLVVMGGFLKHVLIPPDFVNRVVNIHPALIPAFCGQGYYGHHVHEAVLAKGAKISGCTIHFVDNIYDHGPIIWQQTVPVLDDDTPDSLAARVFEAECDAYPEALRLIAAGRVAVEGTRVRIRPDTQAAEARQR